MVLGVPRTPLKNINLSGNLTFFKHNFLLPIVLPRRASQGQGQINFIAVFLHKYWIHQLSTVLGILFRYWFIIDILLKSYVFLYLWQTRDYCFFSGILCFFAGVLLVANILERHLPWPTQPLSPLTPSVPPPATSGIPQYPRSPVCSCLRLLTFPRDPVSDSFLAVSAYQWSELV